MAYMIKISHDKVSDLSEHIEKGLRYLGKAMSIVEEMSSGSEMGDRYGDRMGMRDRDDYDEPTMGERYYGERRGVKGTGRYSRY